MATAVRKKPLTTSGAAHVLSDLIPDMYFYESYVPQRLGKHKDLTVLKYAKAAKYNVLMSGDTGVGKSSLVLAYCAKEKLPLVILPCNGAIEPSQVFGAPVMKEDGSIVFQESNLVQIIRHGGVIFLDEVNFMPPKVAAVLHQLLRERQVVLLDKGGEVIKAHTDCQVLAAYNKDYEGTRPLNEAFKNRFALKPDFKYTKEVEEQLLRMPVTVELAAKLRASRAAKDLDTPVSTNMLIEFEDLAGDLGVEFAMQNFLNAFTEGPERGAVKEVLDNMAKAIEEQVDQMVKMSEGTSQES